MSEPDWISRAVPVKDVVIDIGYLMHDTYYGPEKDYIQKRETHSEQLAAINIERYGDFILSGAVGDSIGELGAYYLRLTPFALLYQKPIARQHQYFWLHPLIFSRGVFTLTFPWYDTLAEAGPLFAALASDNDGLIFDDLDQGWQMEAFARGDELFSRQSNWETNDEHFVIATPRSALRDQIASLQHRVGGQVKAMTKVVGKNFWAKRPPL